MNELTRENLIFALDIGTRSVIGIVGYPDGALFHVCATEQEEYKTRAVVDGQIEDIEETAKIAELVKLRLEKTLGFPLQSVYIAAAGRVLKTVESSHEAAVPEGAGITGEFISKLELGAIRNAYAMLEGEADAQSDLFFCVGHAVRTYTLDGYPISTLIAHRGKTAGVSQIVTFLPREVMESLYTTMARIGLTVAGLTLEPIAAMNAIIPPDLRKLNLALCDIGAGTSDIALCDGGSVSAYTMATIAGDEITEELMRACLIDFQTAEQIKMHLTQQPGSGVSFETILGFVQELSAEELYDRMRPAVEKLARVICEQILATNGKPPAAAFLVGGGSRTPMLQTLVAQTLGLDERHVAVGGNVYLKRMIAGDDRLLSPEYATPLGIAVTAASQRAFDSFVVTVNDRKLHLFNLWDTSVIGVLQLSGYRYRQIMGKAGAGITYTLDGARRIVWGSPPVPAEIARNGAPAALTDPVQPGDCLRFIPALCGEDACLTLGDLISDYRHFSVSFGQKPVSAGRFAIVNGTAEAKEYAVRQGDEIVTVTRLTLKDLCAAEGLSPGTRRFTANGTPCGGDCLLAPGDVIIWEEAGAPASQPPVSAREREASPPSGEKALTVQLNGKALRLLPRGEGLAYQFFDLLPYAGIDARNPEGELIQSLNGQSASYLKELREGDCAEIYWSKKSGGGL